MRSQTQKFFSDLQNKICRAVEEIDGMARFRENDWSSEGEGCARLRVLTEGAVFEKAGVSFSS